MLMRCFWFVITLFLAASAEAQLLSSYVREQVGTLPRGHIMASFVNVNTSIDHVYGHEGNKQALSTNFTKNISFKKIIQDEKVRGNQLSGLFAANGVSLDESAGYSSGTIEGSVNGKIPVLGYGITDTLGVYFSIPIIRFQIASNHSFSQSTVTKKFLQHMNDTDQKSIARDFETALENGTDHKLYESNYVLNPALNKSYLGDLQMNLIQVLDSKVPDSPKISLSPILIFPTASDREVHDLYGLQAGERRFGLGFKSGIEQAIPKTRFKLNASLSGTYRFPAKQGEHLPNGPDDDLNELYDSNVDVSGGFETKMQSQVRYEFPRWISLNGGVLWQKRFKQNLEGSVYSNSVYSQASSQSGEQLTTFYASVDVNSIPSFLEGKFYFPVLAELGVGIPLAGTNAIAEPAVEIQGTLFF